MPNATSPYEVRALFENSPIRTYLTPDGEPRFHAEDIKNALARKGPTSPLPDDDNPPTISYAEALELTRDNQWAHRWVKQMTALLYEIAQMRQDQQPS